MNKFNLSDSVIQKYKPIIGLEIHAQLSTKTKMFAPEAYEYGNLPNSQVSFITLAHPGTLPSVNKKAIDFAIKMGIGCKCEINKTIYFARKNYFYLDLPKGYQITQHKGPICKNGEIIIEDNQGKEKVIRITRIHLEEDTGKSIHQQNETLIDFNRAGAPLIEIVTEPDIETPRDAYLFLHEIRKIVRYLEICDGNMEEGSLRCDANISIMLHTSNKFGQRVEIKNINSIKNVKNALEYEIHRQINELENGNPILSETRNYDAQEDITIRLRLKETLSDYRYFYEPDISPIQINENWIAAIKKEVPLLPREYFKIFINKYKISRYNANILIENKNIALYFIEICKLTANYQAASNWVIGPIKSYLNKLKQNIKEFQISPKQISEIILLIDEKIINFSLANQILFPKLLNNPSKRVKDLVEELNLKIENNNKDVEILIKKTLNSHKEKIKKYKEGQKGLFGMFMGKILKESSKNIDPKYLSKLLQSFLDNYKI